MNQDSEEERRRRKRWLDRRTMVSFRSLDFPVRLHREKTRAAGVDLVGDTRESFTYRNETTRRRK